MDDLVIWSDANLDGTTTVRSVETGELRWEITDTELAQLSGEDTAGIVASQYTLTLEEMLLLPSASAVHFIDPHTGDIEHISADLGGTTRLKTIAATNDHLVIAPTHSSDDQALSFVIYHRRTETTPRPPPKAQACTQAIPPRQGRPSRVGTGYDSSGESRPGDRYRPQHTCPNMWS